MKFAPFPPLLVLLCLAAAVAPLRAAEVTYDWTNLVSDINGVAQTADARLVSPLGVVPSVNRNLWVANSGSGTLTVYDFKGNPVTVDDPLLITVPVVGQNATGTPAGMILDFAAFGKLPANVFSISFTNAATVTVTGPSVFLLATQDGGIFGYSANVNPTAAVLGHSTPGAVYKGLALCLVAPGQRQLYVTNFATGTVDVFDSTFKPVTVAGGFTDPHPVPGFAPFNIERYSVQVTDPVTKAKTINRSLLVSYAKQDPNQQFDVPGAGNGYINVFKPDGTFVKRLVDYSADPASPNELNSPWGMAISRQPVVKGQGTTLLVGNAGDGKIHRYSLADVTTSTPAVSFGALQNTTGGDLQFDGLAGLHFGQKALARSEVAADEDELDEDESMLFFTAGFMNDAHGLVGIISKH